MAVRGLEDGGPTTDGVMMVMVVMMTAHARAATDT